MKKARSLLIILSVAILALAVYYVFGIQNTYFTPGNKVFIQYTDKPICSNAFCSWIDSSTVISPSVSIKSGSDAYSFVSTVRDTIEKKECRYPKDIVPNKNYGSGTCHTFPYYAVWLNDTPERKLDSHGCPIVTFWHIDCLGNVVSQKQNIGYYEGSSDPVDGTIYWGCYQEIAVSKNGQLIDTLKSTDQTLRTYYDDGTKNDGLGVNGKAGITVNMDRGYFSNYECSAYQNSYTILFPEGSYNISVTSPKAYYLAGENITLQIAVDNNQFDSQGRLVVFYEVPTIIGSAKSNVTQDVNLVKGKNTFTYTLPNNDAVKTLKVTPQLTIYYPVSNVQGVNYQSSSLVDGKVILGVYTGDTSEVQIVPRPLYIDKPSTGCPVDYALSENGKYCIRTDVKDLTCFQIGCPSFNNVTYECTSAGICAQTVFVPSKCTTDQYCQETTGKTAAKCDVASGACINDVIYDNIIQCKIADDCLVPCQGISVACETGKCSYTGECSQENLGCKQVGCASGYSCDTNTNVCKKTISSSIVIVIIIVIVIGLFIAIFLGAWLGKKLRK